VRSALLRLSFITVRSALRLDAKADLAAAPAKLHHSLGLPIRLRDLGVRRDAFANVARG